MPSQITAWGANGTHKFKNKTELNKFFQQEGPNAANYILEEFVDGEIVTFDGVADANAEPIYAASHVTPDSIMEMATTMPTRATIQDSE